MDSTAAGAPEVSSGRCFHKSSALFIVSGAAVSIKPYADEIKHLQDDRDGCDGMGQGCSGPAGRPCAARKPTTRRDLSQSYIPELARENGFPALFVSQCGRPQRALWIAGHSFAVDPQGQVFVQTRDDAEQMLCVDVI